MSIITIKPKWLYAFLTVLITAILFYTGLSRLEVDTDIIASLPGNDPVIYDARDVFMHHPALDRIAIDVSLKTKDTDLLLRAAGDIEKRLNDSRLFKTVGIGEFNKNFPELTSYITDNLPVLFSAKELHERVEPLLGPASIRKILENNYIKLSGIEGIGQAEYISSDPLGLREIVLERLLPLIPSADAQVINGQILSSDGNHVLITAVPGKSGMDTEYARRITGLIEEISSRLRTYCSDNQFVLNHVGAYRAALDNENIAKRDTQRALTISTIAICMLLFFAFPRPYIGLLSLVPSAFGLLISVFVYSLFYKSISILAIGFGGAIISIAADQGISYLLFLDRPFETYGGKTAKEVRTAGILTTITTAGAFLFLSLSGYPVLVQIGQFAAIGVTFTFVFVHTVFPLVFPVIPPARRSKRLLLQNIADKFVLSGNKTKAYAALVFFIIMLFFARPEFSADINSLNTVSKETLASEELVKGIWGNAFDKVYMMIEAPAIEDLQKKNDELLSLLNEDTASGSISKPFVPSMIFPGTVLLEENRSAWNKFWTNEKKSALRRNLTAVSGSFNFSPDAFNPFLKKLAVSKVDNQEMSGFLNLIGIEKYKDGSSYIQFIPVTPGRAYNGENFRNKYSLLKVRIFDSKLFGQRLADVLSSSFMRMIVIIGISILIIVFLSFLDWKLTLITSIPLVFSFVCTLGTLKISGQQLNIPSLMLGVVILGMGIDYSIFFVHSYQKYNNDTDPSSGLFRLTVLLAAASNIIGFTALVFADYSLLRSGGIISALGISYSLIGTYTILPVLLKSYFAYTPASVPVIPGSKQHMKQALKRYSRTGAHPKMFARFKMLLDPMFPRLIDFIREPKAIIDIGCGFGIPSVWLLEAFPDARIYAVEPDPERAEVAARVIGSRGIVKALGAPDMPPVEGKADYALMLDMAHLISDNQLKETLGSLKKALTRRGRIIMRVTIPDDNLPHLGRTLETIRVRLIKGGLYYRSLSGLTDIINQSGLSAVTIEPAATGREETWVILDTP